MLSGAVRERPVHVAAYEVTDVSFDAQGGTTSNTNHYTVVVTSLSRPLPEIVVEPRRGLAKLKNRVAGPGNAGTPRTTGWRPSGPRSRWTWPSAAGGSR